MAIIQRYWIDRDWDSRLVNLGTTLGRRIFMLGHMTMGGLTLLLGPTQFLPLIRRKAPQFHRFCGRAYVIMAIGSSIFCLIFIVLKRGVLVGGINMTLAFAAAGACFGYCAYKVYQTARRGLFATHRDWTIRSYSQCLAPMLYRYWYAFLVLMGWYDFEYGTCNADTGICDEYLRTFDMIHCWTYWLFPLAIAELTIRALPPHKLEQQDEVVNNKEEDEETPYHATFVEDNHVHYSASTQIQTDDSAKEHPVPSFGAFNVLGVLISIMTVSVSTAIYAQSLT